VIVVSPPLRRLEAGGWFARSFGVTAGVIVATLAAIMLLVGGAWSVLYWNAIESEANARRNLSKTVKQLETLTEQAKRFAIPRLEQHGITHLSNDTGAVERDGDVILVGTGKAKTGGLKDFVVRYHVASFGKEQRWELQSLIIDGEERFRPLRPDRDE